MFKLLPKACDILFLYFSIFHGLLATKNMTLGFIYNILPYLGKLNPTSFD